MTLPAVLGVFLLVGGLPLFAQTSPVITVQFSELTLNVGESATMLAMVDCPPANCNGVALTLTYPPSMIRVDAIRAGQALRVPGDDEYSDSDLDIPGLVQFEYLASLTNNDPVQPVTPSIPFLEMDVTAIGEGVAFVRFESIEVFTEELSADYETVGVPGSLRVIAPATSTNTPTARPTETPMPQPTDTHTPTLQPTNTHTPTLQPTNTHTPTPKATDVLPTSLPTGTPEVPPTEIAALSCTQLVNAVLPAASAACGGMDASQVCYGYRDVEVIRDGVPIEAFQAGARVALENVDSIHTSALDQATGAWGTAVLTIRANIGDATQNGSGRLIMVGDVTIENTVPDDQLFNASVTITVQANVSRDTALNLRSGPGTTYLGIGSVSSGTELILNGISPDGAWVRTSHPEIGVPVWVSSALVTPNDNLDALPVIEGLTYTTLQSFNLRTAASAACGADNPLPSMLVVQSPPEAEMVIYVNGAEVRVKSTVVMRTMESETSGNPVFQIIALDGEAVVDRYSLSRGYTITGEFDSEQGLMSTWGQPRRLTIEEVEAFRRLETLPVELLNAPITLPTRAELTAPTYSCDSVAQEPNGGLGNGPNTFSWSGSIPGAQYTVVVSDAEGNTLGSAASSGNSATVNVNLSLARGGYTASWTLFASVNGREVCRWISGTVRPA